MTKEEANKFVEELKKKYPKPESAKHTALVNEVDVCNDNYCIGGALVNCFYSSFVTGFPSAFMLSNCLIKLNEQLTSAAALQYAKEIIKYNDELHFEKAYEVLEDVLCIYGNEQ